MLAHSFRFLQRFWTYQIYYWHELRKPQAECGPNFTWWFPPHLINVKHKSVMKLGSIWYRMSEDGRDWREEFAFHEARYEQQRLPWSAWHQRMEHSVHSKQTLSRFWQPCFLYWFFKAPFTHGTELQAAALLLKIVSGFSTLNFPSRAYRSIRWNEACR